MTAVAHPKQACHARTIALDGCEHGLPTSTIKTVFRIHFSQRPPLSIELLGSESHAVHAEFCANTKLERRKFFSSILVLVVLDRNLFFPFGLVATGGFLAFLVCRGRGGLLLGLQSEGVVCILACRGKGFLASWLAGGKGFLLLGL